MSLASLRSVSAVGFAASNFNESDGDDVNKIVLFSTFLHSLHIPYAFAASSPPFCFHMAHRLKLYACTFAFAV